mmetsp:Transcript_15501/g.18806  ORF Transcript_15501/g.18806 Transcript_15501/m.18806 type:complete len:188 (+) Transcript_15501:169-732(+)
MGNAESGTGEGRGRRTSSVGHRQEDAKSKYNENVISDPITIQVDDTLKGLEEFSPIIQHKEILGGMIKRRSHKQDAVDGLDYETILNLWQAVNTHMNNKTKALKEEQTHLKSVSKETFLKCEKASKEVFFSAKKLTDQCRVLHESRPLTGEVEKACSAIKACIERCKFMNDQLPQHLQLETISLEES